MKYVLAHHCDHEDHEGKCGELAYLFEDSKDGKTKTVKEFVSRREAKQYIVTNEWPLKRVMIIPKEEMGE